MSVARLINVAAIFALLLVMPARPAPGRDGDPWPVKGKLIGEKKKSGEVKKSKDVSGVACTTQTGFPRSCLVIDDNLQDAQFVTLEDGKLGAGDTIKLVDNTFDGEPLELDGEGVAFSNGFFYVIGSHGHPRDKNKKLDPVKDADLIKARIAAASQIVRFRADEGASAKIERTANLRRAIVAAADLAPFMDRRLEDNGLTIEGIAIKDDATLFAGFRGPVPTDGKGAVILSVPLATLFAGGAEQSKTFRLKLGEGRGVRDLAVFGTGMLILAGPVADGPGTYAIYFWDGVTNDVGQPFELTQFAPERKPEGLLPLDKNGNQLRLLVLFDGDEEGAPTPVTIP
jgi:uncharacterized protein DUF3616